MRPKFSNSSISMRPEKPINRFSTILNLVTDLFTLNHIVQIVSVKELEF